MSLPSIPQVLSQELVDPQSFSDRRGLFTIPKDFLSSNVKICNVGLYDANVNGKSGLYYPFGIGSASAVLNFYLKCNGETIDSMLNVGEYLTREYLRTSNQNSEDINRFDIINAVNIGLNPVSGAMTYNPPRPDYFHVYGENSDNSEYCPGGLAWQLNNAQDSDVNVTGVLHLRDVLGFFRSTNVLPPMDNFQLEIEWELTGSRIVQDTRASNQIANPAPKPTKPFMVVDHVRVDEDMVSQPMEIPYTSVVREVFRLPAVNAGNIQEENFSSRSVRGNYVKDITLLNQVPSLNAGETFPFNSVNLCPKQLNEKINLTVNNRKFLPLNGADTPAIKQYYFDDAYDLLNINYAAFGGVVDPSGRFLDAVDPFTPNINEGYAPAGFVIGQVISDLEINYTRTGGATNKQNKAMNLVMLATIAKKLLYNNGNVKIVS
jgi:hypothetical protein